MESLKTNFYYQVEVYPENQKMILTSFSHKAILNFTYGYDGYPLFYNKPTLNVDGDIGVLKDTPILNIHDRVENEDYLPYNGEENPVGETVITITTEKGNVVITVPYWYVGLGVDVEILKKPTDHIHRVVCNDGFMLDIRPNSYNLHSVDVKTSSKESLLEGYFAGEAEYSDVPMELCYQVIELHGGIDYIKTL